VATLQGPVLISESESDWDGNVASKSVNVTANAGDLIVVAAMAPDSTVTLSNPTGGTGLTYVPHQNVTASSFGRACIWSAQVPSTQGPFSVQINRSGSSFMWGMNCLRIGNTAGAGASAGITNTSTPTLDLVTGQDSSGIVVVNVDWQPVDGASRAWRVPAGGSGITNGSVNEPSYFYEPSNYTIYIGWHTTAGARGTKTVGLSAPGGQRYAIAALEVLGRPDVPRLKQSNAVRRAATY
jgi:hypothetical protein